MKLGRSQERSLLQRKIEQARKRRRKVEDKEEEKEEENDEENVEETFIFILNLSMQIPVIKISSLQILR